MRTNPNTLVAGIGLSIAALLASGCSSDAPKAAEMTATTAAEPGYEAAPYQLGTYLQTWHEADRLDEIAGVQGIDRIYIAFATPDASGAVSLETPTEAAVRTVQKLGQQASAETYLAVGGWGGTDEQHQAILDGFAWGMEHPTEFANNIKDSVAAAEAAIGSEITGVDLDFEYPSAEQATHLPELVQALHAEGIGDVSLAVSAGEEAAAVQNVASELAHLGVAFNVMTYDLNGPWSDKAGPITDAKWIEQQVEAWVAASGSQAAVHPGIPLYGYEFIGAAASGDAFDTDATAAQAASDGPLICKDVDFAAISPDATSGTSGIQTAEGWASCVTPSDAGAIIDSLRQKYPELGGAFTWDAAGMSQAYADELRPQA